MNICALEAFFVVVVVLVINKGARCVKLDNTHVHILLCADLLNLTGFNCIKWKRCLVVDIRLKTSRASQDYSFKNMPACFNANQPINPNGVIVLVLRSHADCLDSSHSVAILSRSTAGVHHTCQELSQTKVTRFERSYDEYSCSILGLNPNARISTYFRSARSVRGCELSAFSVGAEACFQKAGSQAVRGALCAVWLLT